MMNKIRIVIADDHSVVREGLKNILSSRSDFEVVGDAKDGREALIVSQTMRPDILVLDIAMPELNGLEAVDVIKTELPDVAIVVLSMHDNDNYIQHVLKAGAMGYVLKASEPGEIFEAITSAYQGKYYLSSEINKRVITGFIKDTPVSLEVNRFEQLSSHEKQVFLLLVEGRSIREAADKLFVSPKTIEKHRTAITHKMGLKNRIEMTHYAIKHGIIDLDLLNI